MAKKSFFKKQEQPNFYYMLSRQCEITSRSISLLLKYIDTQEEDLAEQIEHCEKDADKVRRSLIDYVENSFITPLDRHDIFALSRSIDDITDKIKDLKDFLVFFQYQPTDKNLTCAMNEWAHDRIEHFWDDLVKAKKNENQVKRLYWEGIADLEFQEITLKDVIMQREFAKDLNKLANKIGKAADRISDIKIKSIK